jgi:hypothetical protein
MSNHGDELPNPGGAQAHADTDDEEEAGDGNTGLNSKRDQHRAFVAVLKDALHPLNTEAADMKRETDDFFECLESYFSAMGLDDLDDGIVLHDRTRIKMLKSILGKKAKDALEGVMDASLTTYEACKKVVLTRFLPEADDLHSVCLFRCCTMTDDENTKS